MAKEAELANRMVLIRPYQPGDIDRLYEAVRESIAEHSVRMPWCHAGHTVQETRTWIESRVEAWAKGTEYDFSISELSRFERDW